MRDGSGIFILSHLSRAVAILTIRCGPFMSQPSLGRPISFGAGAVIALAMLALGLPANVEAACGSGSSSKAEREAGSMIEHLEILSTDLISHQPTPAGQGRRPCTGPSCSRGGSSEPNAPIPQSLETGDRWLCALVCLEIAKPDGYRRRLRAASPSPVKRASALERPPRSLPISTDSDSIPGQLVSRQSDRVRPLC
jgi:hypothetical protein